MRRRDLTSIDSETSLIFPGVMAPPLVCVSAHDGENTMLMKWDDPDLVPYLCERFERPTTFANFPFDGAVFVRHDERLILPIFEALGRGDVHCIQMREKLNDLEVGLFKVYEDEEGNFKRKSYSLDAIGRRRGVGGKHAGGYRWRLSYHDLYHVPLPEWPEDAKDYACVDAENTYDIHVDQKDHGDEAHQVRAHWCLQLASARGIRTDNNNVQALRSQCEEWIEKIEPHLREEGLIRKNGKRNTKAAVRRMIRAMNENVLPTTKGEEVLLDEFHGDMAAFLKDAHRKGKNVSVNSTACMESGDPVLRLYGVHSKLSNMLSGAVKHLEDGTFLPIQTYFDPLKETGRTSSSGPNIQNVRQGVDLPHPFDLDPEARLVFHPDPRECFVAREGYVLVACDYSGAENHTLAQVCMTLFGESKMAEALNEGRDLHLWVASKITGCSYEEAVGRLAAGDPEIKKNRKLAKPANFGFPGGCGAARLVSFAKGMGTELDEYQAQQLKKMWLLAWPEMKKYFDYIASCETDDGWYYVDHIGSTRVRGRASFTAACNSYFQGLASDGIKAAMWEVTRRQWCEPQSNLAGSYIVNMIHDELILEVPWNRVEGAARELRQVMVDEFNKYTPDVPVSAQVEAMIHWRKEGDKVFDENDEFIWDADQAA